MQPEIEVRFLGVDYAALRHALKTAGATLQQPMHAMRRVIIDYPDQRLQHGTDGMWSILRLRDEGERVVLTYKQIAKNAGKDTHEIETEVSSYDNTLAILRQVGLDVISEQHTRREAWRLGECDVTLDEWPWLPPLVELEGPGEDVLQSVAETLGLDWSKLIRGNAVDAYQQVYPGMSEDSIRNTPLLTFDTMPDWLKERQQA